MIRVGAKPEEMWWGWCSSPNMGSLLNYPLVKTNNTSLYLSQLHWIFQTTAALFYRRLLAKSLKLPITIVSRGPQAAARTGRRTRIFPLTSSTPKFPRARTDAAARAWLARHCASVRAHKVNMYSFWKIIHCSRYKESHKPVIHTVFIIHRHELQKHVGIEETWGTFIA